jgi:hypothetical protein
VLDPAAGTPSGLLPTLVRCQPELLPRFAAYYTQLWALPRRVRRALQRQWRLPLASVALLLALGQSPGLAATIPVSAGCTLIDAITAANTDAATGGCPAGSGADTLVLPAGSTQTLTEVNNSTYGPTGLPVITSTITIAGQESTITRDPESPDFRIMAVGSTGELTLQETTVSGGLSPMLGRGVSGDLTFYSGGGMANYGGMVTVMHSTITNNATAEYCDEYGDCYASSGGGVYNNGTLTITNSTITGNTTRSVGGGVDNNGTLTLTNSIISGNSAVFSGGGVVNSYYGTGTVLNSTLSGNTVSISGGIYSDGNGGGVSNYGTLTLTNSTITGNTASAFFGGTGGGVVNFGTLTLTNSTITGNTTDSSYHGFTAGHGGGVANVFGTGAVLNSTISGNATEEGGGVYNNGALTILNSTITGNTTSAFFGGGTGGGVDNNGTLTILNSTITGNTASAFYYGGNGYGGNGGGVNNTYTLTLARSLVSGNTARTGPEISNSGTLLADNHNLFGVDGTAGVEGFSPGPTDIVPPAGVLLPDILDPTLALNGGPTQTHALVPGSPAIDAGGAVCTDANNAPLLTDQRGRPRLVDGDGDGTAACDIGAFEFFPLINNFVTLAPDLDTAFDPTPVLGGPAGTFTITATFTNTSDTALQFPFFTVTQLSGDNLLLNADEGTQGVGATLTPEVGDRLLAPNETVTVDFVIGLQVQARFTFFVDLFGEPIP